MGRLLKIHPQNPQQYLLREAVKVLRQGGIIVYPTDSGYALGCQIGDKQALDRIRRIRQLDDKHNFTLVCRDLSDIGLYAKFDTATFRILKAYTPGPYTFLLKATHEVPKRLQHPNRKTIGLRIPDHAIALTLLEACETVLMSTTLILPGTQMPLLEAEGIYDVLGKQVDLVIDGGFCGQEPTSVIDLSTGAPQVVRQGKGDISDFL